MSTEAALLAAVLANPDEDTPRLAYADWLDENADALSGRDPAEVRARAELIRLQIAYEGREHEPEFGAARNRSGVLIRKYQKTWQPELPGCKDENRWVLHRGFPEEPRTGFDHFLKHAKRLFELAPVRRLDGTLTPDVIDRLAACRALRRIRWLALSGRRGDRLTRAHFRTFFRSPHLVGLRELRLLFIEDYAELVFKELAASESFAGLEALSCASDVLTDLGAVELARSKVLQPRRLDAQLSTLRDEGLIALVRSPVVERLESLTFSSGCFGTAGAVALAESPHLGPLRHLGLANHEIGPAGVVALARCPRLAGVRSLNLYGTYPGQEGLVALSRSDHLAGVRFLQLGANRLRPAAGKAIAGAPAFEQLRALDLSLNSLGATGVAALAKSARLTRLERLDLLKCSIKDAGTRALAEGSAFRGLMGLNLAQNHIGAAGAIALASANAFPHLRVLNLHDNPIGDAGAVALARSPQLETIEELYLWATLIGDRGAKALIESPHFKRLRRIVITEDRLSPAVQAAFNKRFGPQDE
jgi:uncharacterized protein (TIGR02996 family)